MVAPAEEFNNAVLREIGLVTMKLERTRVALVGQLPGPQPAFEQKPGGICLAHAEQGRAKCPILRMARVAWR